MATYNPKRKINSAGTLEEINFRAKYDGDGNEIVATYATKGELAEGCIPVIETSAASADDLPADATAYYHFSAPVSVTVQGFTLYYDMVLCIKTLTTSGTRYIQIIQGASTSAYYECYRSKYVTSGGDVNSVAWSVWTARDRAASASYAGLMSANNYGNLNTAATYLKYYYLNGAYHYIGGQGTATHSSGKYQHIGRYITSGTVSGTAAVCFTNCSGTVTVSGTTCKVYLSNSPNLTVNGITADNWPNVSIDGVRSYNYTTSNSSTDFKFSSTSITGAVTGNYTDRNLLVTVVGKEVRVRGEVKLYRSTSVTATTIYIKLPSLLPLGNVVTHYDPIQQVQNVSNIDGDRHPVVVSDPSKLFLYKLYGANGLADYYIRWPDISTSSSSPSIFMLDFTYTTK